MDGHSETRPVWHDGERRLQETLGVAARMAAVGRRVIRPVMPDQHREFFAQLPFVVLGSVDDAGNPWATLLEGRPGFLSSPTPATLEIAARPREDDPAAAGVADGRPVGLLGIELSTRRRNRMNGVATVTAAGLRVDVDESFGNCPRYIQLRDVAFRRDPAAPPAGRVEDLSGLDAEARATIAAADTFFVATFADRDGRRQVDASHRGGRAGFVRVAEDGSLTIPDFNGNLFFSTLGNILLTGRAGLLFVDDASGDILQITGEAEVVLESPQIAAFGGAERLWTVRPRRVVRRRGALAGRWQLRADGWSPNALMTGNWAEAADRLRASELATRWRPLRVTRIVDESATIRSFHLQPADGAGLLPHKAGQHLPIRVALPGADRAVIRTYTLSVAPADGIYRISVKRAGAVSRHLHDRVRVGDLIEARAPAGGFTIDARAERPALLVAAGVGVTPMLAMLRHLVLEALRTGRLRPVVLVQAARTTAERPFDREIATLVDAGQGAIGHLRVLSDPSDAQAGRDYDAAGHVDAALLARVLPSADVDVYLCGPPAFMQSIYDALRGLDVKDDRIHAEAFGPSALRRTADAGAAVPRSRRPATEPVPVVFTEALKEARWTPGSGTLLELAEARGLAPEFSCRAGTCGTCRTRLAKGRVAYIRQTTAPVAADEVLICSAVPAAPEGDDAPERIELAL